MEQFSRSRILSVGTSVPENVMTNKDFESFLDTSDEWITTRTGIRERHVIPRDQMMYSSQFGIAAGRIALERANIRPEEVDAIICGTVTPDSFFPSTACKIQAALGCTNAFAFDVMAACSGFIFGLSIADGYIRSGQTKTVLVIGAEILSKTVDWTDRGSCILFGDGAGAAVVQGTNDKSIGIMATKLGSDGTQAEILTLPVWGDKRFTTMKGNEVFKHAVRQMTAYSLKAVEAAGLTLDQIDYLIPHQANMRIISSVGEQLKLPREKIITNLERYGNTSSASIPLALNEAWEAGKIKKGTTVLLTALGGGLTFGSTVVRF
ncbi:MAG: ketoacyl-ACP synthase III [Chitinispirillaceae bacterium]|jgi:3-oxoacyl-[acyl-carrier-protein] synthase-3|nr:ketoacyl-ACP synthase III [Chitinispirillaceae bacterium]